MKYSIKQIAALGNVTTRTLRYYDEIGLLTPSELGDNGYRYYDHNSLLRLQQILFFRELDVPLDEIWRIMNQPDFDPLLALKNHRASLRKRSERLEKLITTINNTIENLEGEKPMNDKKLFEGFDEGQYEEEARQRWGHTPQYAESQKKWSSYSNVQKQQIKEEGGQITRRMVTDDPQTRPDDPGVQAAIGDYFTYINKYFYTCDVQFLKNLSNMWAEDARFAINYDRIREGGAAFVRDAVH
jgi:DNA-binding transcriptional MerR regulator